MYASSPIQLEAILIHIAPELPCKLKTLLKEGLQNVRNNLYDLNAEQIIVKVIV